MSRSASRLVACTRSALFALALAGAACAPARAESEPVAFDGSALEEPAQSASSAGDGGGSSPDGAASDLGGDAVRVVDARDVGLQASAINGGTTGAMVRETTDAGFSCITSTWTVPDYDPTKPGTPWIYYGIGDETSVDMEAGMSFQHGDGTALLPRRWLPYLRQGKTFVFGDESTRVLPGATFTLEARLVGGRVSLVKDGEIVAFSRTSPPIDGLPLAVDPSRAHVRRVVGQAMTTRYGGEALGRFGPVVFAHTSACAAAGGVVSFDSVRGWRDVRKGIVFGSVTFPADRITHLYGPAADADEMTLFP